MHYRFKKNKNKSMKNFKLGLTALALTVATTAVAQTKENPWLVGVGAHGVNHMAVAQGLGKTLTNFDPLFRMANYSIVAPLSKLTVARNINKSFVLDMQATVGNVDNKRFSFGKEFMLNAGLGVQYKINSLWNVNSWFDPYLRIGGSYMRYDTKSMTFPRMDVANNFMYSAYDRNGLLYGKIHHFMAAGGAGMNLWVTKGFGFNVQGDYLTTPTNHSDVVNFWQASASLLFRFGGDNDKDKDGIADKDDKCPNVPGPKENMGCPWGDTDGDGVMDNEDKCVDVAGPADNMGCPLPDTDGDGVLDKDDKCVDVAGPADNMGCPWPDTDGDGVLDKDDACVNVPGLAEYKGCPKPASASAEEATLALKNLTFNLSKATLRPESNAKIEQAAKVILSTKGETFLIEGHTDVTGKAANNLKLSKARAATVVKALEARGVNPSQLKSKGVGSAEATMPASASNDERLQDRKVIIKAVSGAEWDALKKTN